MAVASKPKPSVTEALEASRELCLAALEVLEAKEMRVDTDVATSNVRHLLEKTGRKSFRFADIAITLTPQPRPIYCKCCNQDVTICPNIDAAIAGGGTISVYRCERALPDRLSIRRVDNRLAKREWVA